MKANPNEDGSGQFFYLQISPKFRDRAFTDCTYKCAMAERAGHI